ncbi:MAG: hypothetical protein M1831_003853 [Alyxoria varia]|nr:MAG: hypothetical protein M1831_003853 [Alyxoria varia]
MSDSHSPSYVKDDVSTTFQRLANGPSQPKDTTIHQLAIESSSFEAYEKWLRGDSNWFLSAIVTVSNPILSKTYRHERIPEMWMLGDLIKDKTFQNKVVDALVDWRESKWSMELKTLQTIIELMRGFCRWKLRHVYNKEVMLEKVTNNDTFECPLVRCAIALYVLVAKRTTLKRNGAREKLPVKAIEQIDRVIETFRKGNVKKVDLRVTKEDFHV